MSFGRIEDPTRRLGFTFKGKEYVVRAIPLADGWEATIFSGNDRVPGYSGTISAEQIQDAAATSPGVDFVEVLMENLRNDLIRHTEDAEAAEAERIKQAQQQRAK